MAFSFSASAHTAYASDALILLGLSADDPFVNEGKIADATILQRLVEREVNAVVTFDTLPAGDQVIAYDAAVMMLAGQVAMKIMPVAIPKYLSDNKAVFDRFRTTDFRVMGQELYSEGTSLLEALAGGDITGIPTVISIVTPGTNILTGE